MLVTIITTEELAAKGMKLVKQTELAVKTNHFREQVVVTQVVAFVQWVVECFTLQRNHQKLVGQAIRSLIVVPANLIIIQGLRQVAILLKV